ncbi:MAG: Gfo/Idh/MocA family oxidoreductase [Verrucomicrobiota bacterium]
MTNLSRRNFLKSTAIFAAGASLSARSWAQVAGANSDIRMAVIGFRSRGAEHIKEWTTLKGCRLVALCDCDQSLLDKVNKNRGKETVVEGGIDPVTGKRGKGQTLKSLDAETYLDMRKMLENKNIDAVSIATPNHWHSLAAIWAIQAGKDVYCEKPISHNIWEGRQLVKCAANHKQIVASGTQSRSSLEGIQAAVNYVKEGNLGKIIIARGLCYKPRKSIGLTEGAQTVPDSINYDLWCGPAPMDPPRRNSKANGPVHYEWHWFWAYGAGDLGNQGIHQMDISRWFLGEAGLAPFVLSAGGRVGYRDDAETPNTQIVYQGYEKAPLIFEVRGLPSAKDATAMDKYKGASVGVVVECENGYVSVPNYTSASAHDKDGKVIKEWKGAENHFGNFLKAVRSRKESDLNASILEGHVSSSLCHTGNVSYRVGAKKSQGEILDGVKAYKGMQETYERMKEHLAKNDVNIDNDKLTLGQPLKFDVQTERFDNEAANALLKRQYRAPYIVPENV